MTTPLAKKLAGAAPAAARSPLAAVLERGARGELVELPVLGPAWVQLVGAEDVQRIEADVFRAMKERGLDPTVLHAMAYEADRAVRTLACAVRSADDRAAAFGTEIEWGKVDSDTIAACWEVYMDVRERLAPMDAPLTPERRAELERAYAKKNATSLRAFALRELVTWLLSTEFPPATPPTTKSSDGPSLPAS